MNKIIKLQYKSNNFILLYKDLLKRCRIYTDQVPENIVNSLDRSVNIGKKLIMPKYSFCDYKIKSKINNKIILDNNYLFEFPKFYYFFKNCFSLSIITLTVGEKISKEINKLQKEDKISQAFFLDAFASESTEAFANYINNILKDKNVNFTPTARFSPGFSDLPLSIQPDILKLSKAETINVSYKGNSYILLPEKSITALIGWEND